MGDSGGVAPLLPFLSPVLPFPGFTSPAPPPLRLCFCLPWGFCLPWEGGETGAQPRPRLPLQVQLPSGPPTPTPQLTGSVVLPQAPQGYRNSL